LWHLADYYYYLKEANLPIDSSLAEFLLTKKENGFAFIPDFVIEDLLNRFPELEKEHPKIYETLGQKKTYITLRKQGILFLRTFLRMHWSQFSERSKTLQKQE
jgi:hypothetical protein